MNVQNLYYCKSFEMSLIIITGPPKCGKSIFSESIARSLSSEICYIATLPNILLFSDCIREHQLRRPNSWCLIELLGHLELDMKILYSLKNKDILLEGLAFYLFRLFPAKGIDEQLDQAISKLLECIVYMNNNNRNLIIVSSYGDSFHEDIKLSIKTLLYNLRKIAEADITVANCSKNGA